LRIAGKLKSRLTNERLCFYELFISESVAAAVAGSEFESSAAGVTSVVVVLLWDGCESEVAVFEEDSASEVTIGTEAAADGMSFCCAFDMISEMNSLEDDVGMEEIAYPGRGDFPGVDVKSAELEDDVLAFEKLSSSMTISSLSLSSWCCCGGGGGLMMGEATRAGCCCCSSSTSGDVGFS